MKLKQVLTYIKDLTDKGDSFDEAKKKAVVMLDGDAILDETGAEVAIDQIMLVTAGGDKREDETEEEKAKREDDEEAKRKLQDDEEEEEDVAKGKDGSQYLTMKQLEAAIAKMGKSQRDDAASQTNKATQVAVVSSVSGGDPRNDLAAKTAGFNTFGELAMAVKNYVVDPMNLDVRLKACITGKSTPTNVSVGQIGADGGFAIAPQFLAEILRHTFDETSIFSMCRQLNTSGNSLEIPKDETVAWGTDGVQVNWTAENVNLTDSKLKLGVNDIKLHKLAALVPMTNELLEDNAVSLDTYLNQVTPEKIRYKVDDAIINGSGAGQPLGIRNSGALKTVTRVTATGIDIDEIADLMAAQPGWSLNRATFLSHTTVLPDIIKAQIGSFPVFMAPGELETRTLPGGLMGRPLLIHETAQARDNAGDLALHDFTQYICVTKSTNGGIRGEMSIHLYFDRDVTAFRFTMRIGGQPWLTSTITQDNGGGTISPFAEIGPT